MKNKRYVVALVVLVLASIACSMLGGGAEGSDSSAPLSDDTAPGEEPQQKAPALSGSGNVDTEFPMPPEVENVMDLGDGVINYQTTMSLTDVVEFYRTEFENAGYDERDITTVINDTTFSIVWDGHPSGQAIVVQGVDLGNGTINVNVRYEDV